MMKSVISAGLLGAVVLMAWTVVVNGLLGFQARLDMKPLPAERQVYDVLREHVPGPGRYLVNPEADPQGRVPIGEPVYSVLYGGMGHEAAGGLAWVGLPVLLLPPMIGAWLLSHATDRLRASYGRKVLFFAAIGLLLAVSGDLARYGIGGYPLGDAMAYAVNHTVAWTLAGLVVAWRIRPRGAPADA